MKIAMIGQKGIPATWGGVEQHVDHLSQELRALKHDIFVYSREYYVNPSFVAAYNKQQRGIQVISLPTVQSKNIDTIVHTFLATMHAMLFLKPDVYHFHSVGPSLLSWLPRVFRPRTKVVVTFHCEDRLHQKWGRFARFMLTLGEWTATHFPHQTITVSKTLQAYALEKYGRTAVYIPNGVDIVSPLNPAQITQQWGLTKGEYILTVARLVRHKGIHHVIEAFKKTTTEKKLVIVGGSTHTDEYVQYLHKLAYEDRRIIFTGFQSGTILNELFANAYLYVQPSESEGLSVAVLEAASFARPILASDIPANAEIVAGNGLLFCNADSTDLYTQLQYALNNPEKIENQGIKLQQCIVQKYDWKTIAKEISYLYNTLFLNKKKSMFTLLFNGKRAGQLLLLAMISVGLLLASTQKVSAAFFSVNSTVDVIDDSPNDGMCQAEGYPSGTCTLRAAIIEANALAGEDEIYVPAGYYTLTIDGTNDDSGFYGDLDVLDTVIIRGEDADTTFISAGGAGGIQDRVFDVLSGETVSLENFSIQDGYLFADYCFGAGIQQSQPTLVLRSIHLEFNRCETSDGGAFGAGLFSWGSAVTMEDSRVEENELQGEFGSLYGVGIFSLGQVSLTNVSVSDNQGQTIGGYVDGGGMVVYGDLNMVNTVVHENVITSSDSDAYAAGIDAVGNTMIQNSLIDHNRAISAHAGAMGGGIVMITGVISNTTIYENVTTSNVDASGGGIVVFSDVALDHVTVVDNEALTGAQIFYTEYGTALQIKSSIISGEFSELNCGFDPAYSITSLGYNLENGNSCGFNQATDQVNTDPMFDSNGLQDNGGSTQTLALQAESPAVNTTPVEACLDVSGNAVTADQRYQIRMGYCDSGAYEYFDNVAPVFTLVGDTSTTIECQIDAPYTEPGFSAIDAVDGDLTNNVEWVSTVNQAAVGVYGIVYTVVDFSQNTATANRNIQVVDTTAPTIVLNGQASVQLAEGSNYTDEGAVVNEACDSTAVQSLVTNNPVNTAVPGTYIVTYTVSDVNGNSATATRTVVVTDVADETTEDTTTDSTDDGDEETVVEDETPSNTEEVRSIISLDSQEDGTLVITYEDGTTDVITPFDGDTDFQYVMSSVGNRVIVTNGKFVRLYVNGVQVAQQRVNKKKPKFVQLQVAQLFDTYESVVVLTKRQGKLKTTVLRLTNENAFKKNKHRVVALTDAQLSKALKMKVKVKKHRIMLNIGEKEIIYRLTKKGKLKEIRNK